jgi:hypothetical protein
MIQERPAWRGVLPLLLLFAVTFATALGYLHFQRTQGSDFSDQGAAAAMGGDVRNGTAGADVRSSWSGADETPPGATAAELYSSSDALANGNQVAASSTIEQRAEAMNRLGALSTGLESAAEPATLQALEIAAMGAPDWQLRLRAVNLVARAAVQESADRSYATMILQRAATDPNSVVALRARNALEGLQPRDNEPVVTVEIPDSGG